MARPRP